VNEAIQNYKSLVCEAVREAKFSEVLAVGSEEYLSKLHSAMGVGHRNRKIVKETDGYCTKEPEPSYNSNFDGGLTGLRFENSWSWEEMICGARS